MAEPTQEIITAQDRLAEACREWADCPVIGFDTEFVGEDTYHPELCLVQVAVPGRLYLIDPYSAGPLDPFWKLLHDPARVSVVHAGREEVRLCRLLSGAPPANLFDIQIAAGLVSTGYPLGHAAVVQQLLGHRLNKGETLTEWRRRPLTPEQIRYAFDDVRYLLRAWEKLMGRLEQFGRVAWAREEFARLARLAGPEDPALEERWRKLKGCGPLDRRKLAIVRALFQWREQRAAELNRPARTIVRDDLIVEIARRNPSRARDLQVVRGLPSRDLDAIVETVERARGLPLEECPEVADREQDSPQVGMAVGLLMAALGDFCTRERLAQGLVASNQDVKTLVRAHAQGEPFEGSPLTGGWRAAHVLPHLRAVLEGRRAVRIRDLRADAPLDYVEHAG